MAITVHKVSDWSGAEQTSAYLNELNPAKAQVSFDTSAYELLLETDSAGVACCRVATKRTYAGTGNSAEAWYSAPGSVVIEQKGAGRTLEGRSLDVRITVTGRICVWGTAGGYRFVPCYYYLTDYWDCYFWTGTERSTSATDTTQAANTWVKTEKTIKVEVLFSDTRTAYTGRVCILFFDIDIGDQSTAFLRWRGPETVRFTGGVTDTWVRPDGQRGFSVSADGTTYSAAVTSDGSNSFYCGLVAKGISPITWVQSGGGETGISLERVTNRYPDVAAPTKGIVKAHEQTLSFASTASARQGQWVEWELRQVLPYTVGQNQPTALELRDVPGTGLLPGTLSLKTATRTATPGASAQSCLSQWTAALDSSGTQVTLKARDCSQAAGTFSFVLRARLAANAPASVTNRVTLVVQTQDRGAVTLASNTVTVTVAKRNALVRVIKRARGPGLEHPHGAPLCRFAWRGVTLQGQARAGSFWLAPGADGAGAEATYELPCQDLDGTLVVEEAYPGLRFRFEGVAEKSSNATAAGARASFDLTRFPNDQGDGSYAVFQNAKVLQQGLSGTALARNVVAV